MRVCLCAALPADPAWLLMPGCQLLAGLRGSCAAAL